MSLNAIGDVTSNWARASAVDERQHVSRKPGSGLFGLLFDRISASATAPGTFGPVNGQASSGPGNAAPSAFSAVTSAGKGFTEVRQEDGSVARRIGTRAWRNNNPGNLEFGSFAKSHGAVGSDGRFAVFATPEAGRKAQAALIFESAGYRKLSIASAMQRYAPPFENNTNAYSATVARAVGVPETTPLSSLDAAQRQRMLDAMAKVEDGTPGRVVAINGPAARGGTAPLSVASVIEATPAAAQPRPGRMVEAATANATVFNARPSRFADAEFTGFASTVNYGARYIR